MFDPRIGTCLRRAARLLERAGPPAPDAALLDRLARARDPAAFAELLTRHGPAVWALCRRVVRSEADAEDVFQATFLVLVRDAARVQSGASLGSWLYAVAVRIGRKARARAERVPDPARLAGPAPAPDPAEGPSWAEIRSALDEELARLPDVLRAPILLCYFEGMTQDEAAAALGWNPRTVKARVARARERLRARLNRRGIELSAVLAVPLLSAHVASAVPEPLSTGLTEAAASLLAGRPAGPGVSPAALALTRTEGPAVSLVRVVALLVSAVGLFAAGALLGRPLDPIVPPPVVRTDEPPAPAPGPELKVPGAVRIGTTRYRPAAGWHKKLYFTADGRTLVAPLGNKAVELWDPETGLRTHEIPVPNGHFHDSDFFARGNLLALLGFVVPDDRAAPWQLTVWIVDAAARKVLRSVALPDYEHSVRHTVRFAPDGKRLFISLDTQIRVLDVNSGEELIRQKHKEWPDVFAVSPDGKTVVYGRYDLYLWKWEAGEEPKKFVSLGGFGSQLAAFGPDNKTLFVAASGGRVLLFDLATGRQTGTLDLGDSVLRWSFSPDGQTLAATYYETTRNSALSRAVVLWDPATGKERGRLPVGRTTASNAGWSPDGTRLASATDSRLWVWDVKTQKPLGPAEPGHEGSISAFAFGPDGRLYTASDDHTIRSWDATTGKAGLELVHDYWVRGAAVSPDGALVVGSSLRNDLRVWDAKTGAERFKLLGSGRHGGSRKVRFTPDGKRFVTWGDDMYLRVWEVRNGKLLTEHRVLPESMTRADPDDEEGFNMRFLGSVSGDISADGSTFAYVAHRNVQVFDVETGKEQLKFEGDPNGVGAVALAPDGKRLVVAGRAKQSEIRLPNGSSRSEHAPEHRTAVWDLATKKVVWEATPPGWWPRALAVSPDGRRIAEITATRDEKYAVWVWDSATGKDLGRIELPGPGYACAFDRTGKKLAVAHQDTTATVYELDSALKK
jgi:RNA polymerase sigma factor (sigma-70 family)